MYKAVIKNPNYGEVEISAETIEGIHMVAFRMNENVYVGDTLIAAKDGKDPAHPNTIFGGYTIGGLKKLYGEI